MTFPPPDPTVHAPTPLAAGEPPSVFAQTVGAANPYQPRFDTPPPARSTSAMAIVALVLSIVLWAVGTVAVVLGVVALRRIKRSGEKGRGLAIAAIIIGLIGQVGFGAVIVNAVVSRNAMEAENITEATSIPVESLGVNHCIGPEPTGPSSEITVVPCAEPHIYQVFAVAEKGIDGRLSDAKRDKLREKCIDVLGEEAPQVFADAWVYVLEVYDDPNSAGIPSNSSDGFCAVTVKSGSFTGLVSDGSIAYSE